MKLVEYFKEKDQIKRVITILHQFVELLRLKDNDGGCQIDAQFKKIIQTCNNEHVLISQAYTNYLEVILRYKPATSYIHAIEPAFRQALSTYQIYNNHSLIIRTSERFIQLILQMNSGRSIIEAAFKELALDLEKSSLFQIALHIYTYLGKFIIKYQTRDDFILAGFVISRCKFLKQKDLTVNSDTQQMLIDLIVFYRNAVYPQFIVDDYLKTMKENYEPQSTTGIYMSLLAFCFKHRPEHYIEYQCMPSVFTICLSSSIV